MYEKIGASETGLPRNNSKWRLQVRSASVNQRRGLAPVFWGSGALGCRARRRSSQSSQIALTKCIPPRTTHSRTEHDIRPSKPSRDCIGGLKYGGKLSYVGARLISFSFQRQARHIRLSRCWPNPFNEILTSGYYTNFANLLDLSTVAALAGFDSRKSPFGVMTMAPAGPRWNSPRTRLPPASVPGAHMRGLT